VTKRQQKIRLRRLFDICEWHWKLPPVHQLRNWKKAVYFARIHGLEITDRFADRIIVKVFWRLYERECETCRAEVIEQSVYSATGSERLRGCVCSVERNLSVAWRATATIASSDKSTTANSGTGNVSHAGSARDARARSRAGVTAPRVGGARARVS
jgi:hypothetical protein